MNKQEITIGAILIVLLLSFSFWSPYVFKSGAPAGKPAVTNQAPSAASVAAPKAAASAPAVAPVAPPAARPAVSAPVAAPAIPARLVETGNDYIRLSFSARGGGLQSVVISKYKASNRPGSGPVALDFGARPALSIAGLGGIGPDTEFDIQPAPGGRGLVLKAVAGDLQFQRIVAIESNYYLRVTDQFSNRGGAPLMLPPWRLALGAMTMAHALKGERPVDVLGVDTLSPGGEGVKFWGSKIPGWLKEADDAEAVHAVSNGVDWVAVCDKYFVQILRLEKGAEEAVIGAQNNAKGALEAVWARATMAEISVPAGESVEQVYYFYVGPKNYGDLKSLGYHQEAVLDYGMWARVATVLLVTLRWLHDNVYANYGVAIILLTFLVRMLFWPITHFGTKSMKRMQEIQPLVVALREKIKEPQKQQQAIMALYKEHRVNPLGGCLPMLIQIPVFIALFYVLRNAIELRNAPFLWIHDLSQPENMLVGMLPFGLALNTLPLMNSLLMFWQQKITPATGDPTQRKMMMMMPLFMLFFFYTFASGLVLYWNVSQLVSILQQVWINRTTPQIKQA